MTETLEDKIERILADQPVWMTMNELVPAACQIMPRTLWQVRRDLKNPEIGGDIERKRLGRSDYFRTTTVPGYLRALHGLLEVV